MSRSMRNKGAKRGGRTRGAARRRSARRPRTGPPPLGWLGVILAALLALDLIDPPPASATARAFQILGAPADALRFLLGRSAFVLPVALVGVDLVRWWHVHYVPRRRKTILILGTSALVICLHQGLGQIFWPGDLGGGVIGKAYFRMLQDSHGRVVGAFAAWIGVVAMACLLMGWNPRRSRVLQGISRHGGRLLLRGGRGLLGGAWALLLGIFWETEEVEVPVSGLERSRRAQQSEAVPPDLEGGPSSWRLDKQGAEAPPWLAAPRDPEPVPMPATGPDVAAFEPNPLFDPAEPLDPHILPGREPGRASGFPPEQLADLEQIIVRTAEDTAGLKLAPSPRGAQIGMSTICCRFKLAEQQNRSVTRIHRIVEDLELAIERRPVDVVIDRDIRVIVPLVGHERSYAPIKELLLEAQSCAGPHPVGLIGRKADGTPCFVDFRQNPHWLVAGATGSGKTVGLLSVLFGLVFLYPPYRVRISIADHKQDLSGIFRGLPHLFHAPVSDRPGMLIMLDHLRDELTRRKSLGAKKACEEEPTLITVVDEFHGFRCSDALMELVAESRAFGMYFILATQHPTADIVDTTIKANLVTRVAFRVASESASRLIIGTSEAEALLGRGDCLVRTVEGIERIQAGWVTNPGEADHSDTEELQEYLERGPEEISLDES